MAKSDTDGIHPIRDFPRGTGSVNAIKFAEIRNPMPEEVSDGHDLKKIFDIYPYIPYAFADKVTSQMLKWYLLNSGYMSETKGNVITKTSDFAFGGQYQYIRSSNPRLFIPNFKEEITDVTTWNGFNDFVSGIDLCGDDYVSMAYKLNHSKMTVGEMGMEVIWTGIADIDLVRFNCVMPDKYMPVYKDDSDDRWMAISPKFSTHYLKKYPAREVPVWPNYKEFPDGSIRTFLFAKDGRYKYVGRPDDYGNFPTQYNQYKLNVMITKMIKKKFMPEVLIELEEGGFGFNPNAINTSNIPSIENIGTTGNPFGNPKQKSILRKIEEQFSAEGRAPTSIMAITRKAGMKPFKVHEFKHQAKENFYLKLFERFEESIMKANHFPRALMMDQVGGFNSSQFMDIFEIHGATKILKHQLAVGGFINEALHVAAEFLDMNDMKNYAIKFNSPLQDLINRRIEATGNKDGLTETELSDISASN